MRAPKTPVSTATSSSRSASQKRFVQRVRLLRRRGVREARAISLRRVRDQGEVAHDEDGAARVEDAAVELALVVLEDAQASDAAGHALGGFRVVLARDPEQDAQARPDLPHDLVSGAHTRLGDALDDGPHLLERAQPSRVMLATRAQRPGELQVAAGLARPAELLERASEPVVRVVVCG